MRRFLVIGIGAGDPEYVTAQAIRALNEVDVFFLVDKGEEKHDLLDLRHEICERYIERPAYRSVAMRDPDRDRTAAAYGPAVEAWRSARSALYEEAIRAELGDGECGGMLVWGDPALYDSTLAAIEGIVARGTLALEYEVIPGISSVQALAARHRIALNRVGRPFEVTTGRRLAEGLHDDVDDVVVMLDAGVRIPALRRRAGGHLLGRVPRHARRDPGRRAAWARSPDEIERVRAEARERKGWIMDTYLLRRRQAGVAARRVDASADDARQRRADEDEGAHVHGRQVEVGERRDRDRLLVAADCAREHDRRLAGAVLQQERRARGRAARGASARPGCRARAPCRSRRPPRGAARRRPTA